MHFKQKLTYMALGCLFTIIGYILASLSGNPVDAQSQENKSEPTVIDEIVCRSLKVVDENGKTLVAISEHPIGRGYIDVHQPNGEFTSITGDSISIGDPDEIEGFFISKRGVSINYQNHKNIVFMGIGDSNEGIIQIWTENRKGAIQLSGDNMAIFNKGGEKVLQASVGDMGGGGITTRDKNGYRTGRLP